MSSISSSAQEVTPDLRIRKLGFLHRNLLSQLLDENYGWKTLAEVITNPDDPTKSLFSARDINILELEWRKGKTPAEAFIQHWSTFGTEQPKLKDLIKFLKEAKMLRVAYCVEREILKNSCKDVEDKVDTAIDVEDKVDTAIDVTSSEQQNGESFNKDDFQEAFACIDLGEITKCDYDELSRATTNFSDQCKLGEGSYGCVYEAKLFGKRVAVKRLKSAADKQFLSELKVLPMFKHENLLPLLGCSFSGQYCCLIYDYMENGSLQDRLDCKDKTDPLVCELRMSIAYGTALGLNHLHTFGKSPLVHRDVKSANVLLDKNFVPKVGDFGLVRIGDSANSSTKICTKNICGTPVYMAWEAFNHEVSVKLDTFSFGVVLLELLTGLPPYDQAREDKDLISFMENYDDILDIIDPKIPWDETPAKRLYSIAQSCLNNSKRKRPAISEILNDLKQCCSGESSSQR